MDINKNDKFVACWGYDQTQYSIYNVVDVKGKSVFVEGLNGWSSLSNSDLSEGSQVKVYKYKYWTDLTQAEQDDYTKRGFDWHSYQHHYGKDNLKNAKTKTIAKVNRIDGQSWTYVWTFTDGTTYSSEQKFNVEIVKGVKKCLVNTRYGEPSIKLNETIRASIDKNYNSNKQRYIEQNEYTAYNGH